MSLEKSSEMVDIPEEEIVRSDVSDRRKRGGVSPAVKLGGLIAGGAVLIGGAIFLMSAQQPRQETVLAAPPTLDTTPGGRVQAGSPEFQERLREANEARAQLAEERAITFMPTPEIVLQPTPAIPLEPERVPGVASPEPPRVETAQRVERRILAQPPRAEPRVPPPQPEPVTEVRVVEAQQVPPQQPEENPFIQGMVNFMASAARSEAPIRLGSAQMPRPAWLDEDPAAQGANPSGNSPETGPATRVVLRPGDILTAQMVNSVNSDANAPVLAEVVSGAFRGARLVGSFQASPAAGSMVVSFRTMSLPDGTSFEINAFAVDGRSAEAAVASDVDRRLVARYGPVLASTFISAYAQALAQPRRRILGTGQDIEVEVDRATSRQAAFAGLSAGATAIGSDIAASAPKGPLVHLRSGHPLAILFVEPVELPAT